MKNISQQNWLSFNGAAEVLLSKIIGFIQYQIASHRNQYPCKFIGEKPNEKEFNNTIIMHKEKGRNEIFETPIKNLLENVELIVKFHPKDAIKLGTVAMGDVLFSEKKEMTRKKFDEMKTKILDPDYLIKNIISYEKNYYPFNLVGSKCNHKDKYKTIVLYTIIKKREIFEISVENLISNYKFLEKFNPITAIKLGSVAMGDALFETNNYINDKNFQVIKNKILSSIRG